METLFVKLLSRTPGELISRPGTKVRYEAGGGGIGCRNKNADNKQNPKIGNNKGEGGR